MSDYVGKSPISLEVGIAKYLELVAVLEEYYKEPGEPVYKTYAEVFEEVVRDAERQFTWQAPMGNKNPYCNLDYSKFVKVSTNPKDPLPPKDLKYSEVCSDLEAYFIGCGYQNVILTRVKVSGHGLIGRDWDDSWGWPETGYYQMPPGYEWYRDDIPQMGNLVVTILA